MRRRARRSSNRNARGAETVAAATRWLAEREDGGEPWFGWVHLYEPHYPYAAAGAICVAIFG